MANQETSEIFFMEIREIPLEKIFLDLKNPRHPAYQSEEEVITYLCSKEYVLELAKDIVQFGINPLELMAVIQNPDKKTYFAAEGNRRLCALKLLEDPQLAPKDQRKEFKALSRKQLSHTVRAIVFKDRDAVSHWLERTHGGLQNGIGRKQWDAEQKTRFTGDKKNLMAQQLLDYAQGEGMINAEERSKKLSTVQRFISNPVFKDALGIDTSDNKRLQSLRVKEDFDIVLGKFIEDLITGAVNTRHNSGYIKEYSKMIRELKGLINTPTHPTPLSALGNKSNSADKSAPSASSKTVDATNDEENTTQPAGEKSKPARRLRYLGKVKATEEALQKLNNHKLNSLYGSLCSLVVDSHCPLLTIGLWSFVESLTALNGRSQNTDFQAFLSAERLSNLGLGNGKDSRALRDCLRRLCENGNSSKHDKNSAAFNDQQLINDFSVLQQLIQKLIQCACSSGREEN